MANRNGLSYWLPLLNKVGKGTSPSANPSYEWETEYSSGGIPGPKGPKGDKGDKGDKGEGGLKIVFVETLPTKGSTDTLYLVPSSDPTSNNATDEYVWSQGKFELVGSTSIDISGKQDVISDIETIRTNANQGATALQQLAGKQATLVSGTNIKTVNNQSILGSGNISIEGGSGQADTNNLSNAKTFAEMFSDNLILSSDFETYSVMTSLSDVHDLNPDKLAYSYYISKSNNGDLFIDPAAGFIRYIAQAPDDFTKMSLAGNLNQAMLDDGILYGIPASWLGENKLEQLKEQLFELFGKELCKYHGMDITDSSVIENVKDGLIDQSVILIANDGELFPDLDDITNLDGITLEDIKGYSYDIVYAAPSNNNVTSIDEAISLFNRHNESGLPNDFYLIDGQESMISMISPTYLENFMDLAEFNAPLYLNGYSLGCDEDTNYIWCDDKFKVNSIEKALLNTNQDYSYDLFKLVLDSIFDGPLNIYLISYNSLDLSDEDWQNATQHLAQYFKGDIGKIQGENYNYPNILQDLGNSLIDRCYMCVGFKGGCNIPGYEDLTLSDVENLSWETIYTAPASEYLSSYILTEEESAKLWNDSAFDYAYKALRIDPDGEDITIILSPYNLRRSDDTITVTDYDDDGNFVGAGLEADENDPDMQIPDGIKIQELGFECLDGPGTPSGKILQLTLPDIDDPSIAISYSLALDMIDAGDWPNTFPDIPTKTFADLCEQNSIVQEQYEQTVDYRKEFDDPDYEFKNLEGYLYNECFIEVGPASEVFNSLPNYETFILK